MTPKQRFALAMVLMFVLLACAGPSAEIAAQATEYEGLQLACVDKATTKQEADECRCAIKRTWHRAGPECAADGGAP